jgi:hypothetical protein
MDRPYTPTEGQIELAKARMRRWLGSWSTDELRALAGDTGLPQVLRDAIAAEVESRLMSALALGGMVCWP